MTANAAPLRMLRRRWSVVGLVGGAGLFAAGAGLSQTAGLAIWRWTLPAIAVWLYLWLVLWSRLDQHRPAAGRPPFSRLGPGTFLSSVRAWCLAGLGGFLFIPALDGLAAWYSMILYTAADVADYFDGYLARRTDTVSEFGVAFDLELDALGLLIAVSLAVGLGKLPWLFLPIGLARYGFALLEWARQRAGLQVYDLPSSLSRRPIAGWTMGYVSATLWPILDRPELTLAGVLFFLPFAASFFRDGLVVSGVVDPNDPAYERIRSRARRIMLRWLPLGLRLGLALFVIRAVPGLLVGSEVIVASLARFGYGQAGGVSMLYGMLIVLFSGLCVAGIAGRFAAFLLLFPMGLLIAAAGLEPLWAVGLVAAIGLLMLGTGVGSIWMPSDQIFRQRPGSANR